MKTLEQMTLPQIAKFIADHLGIQDLNEETIKKIMQDTLAQEILRESIQYCQEEQKRLAQYENGYNHSDSYYKPTAYAKKENCVSNSHAERFLKRLEIILPNEIKREKERNNYIRL